MKKRDKFLISLPLYGAVFVLISVLMALNHLIDFNSSYMKEEHSELRIFYKQVEWALKPYLANKNFEMVRSYCKDFENDPDFRVRVLDGEKNFLIADSKPADKLPEDASSHFHSLLPKENNMTYSGYVIADNTKYYIELILSEAPVVKILVEAQWNIIIFFISCFIFLLLCTIFIILKIQIPFNTLQRQVVKIAKGELDTEIELPESRILHELAGAVSVMAHKLKNQIIRLRQLEEFRKDFIANVSHEVKTPLTAITSAVELLETKNDYAEKQDVDCLNILAFQAKRLNNLINDILALAQIEDRQTNDEKHFCKFNLNELISNAIHHLNIEAARVNFISEEEINFYGNEQLIEQAVTNLIVNAIKYSHSDVIDVKLTRTDNNIRIDVTDYGIGIAPEHLDRIFERFYRVDKARSRATGGTGLGLAIVKNIAILHNGTVEVKSEINKETTFSIILPVG